MNWVWVAITSILLSLQVSAAHAATEDDQYGKAFAGNWITYSSDFSEIGKKCILKFSSEKTGEFYPIETSNCSGSITVVNGWAVIDGQLRLVAEGNKIVATLGGNQFRMSGLDEKSGNTFIIEKEQQARAVAKALNAINCSYIGYSNECAEPSQYAAPAIAKGGRADVTVLMNLNARSEPRPDAAVLGVLNAKSCIKVKACTQASDGLWCQAEFGNEIGWFKKQAVRQDKWPVLTFVSGCK